MISSRQTPLVGSKGKFELRPTDNGIYNIQIDKEFNGDNTLGFWLPIGYNVSAEEISNVWQEHSKTKTQFPTFIDEKNIQELSKSFYTHRDDLSYVLYVDRQDNFNPPQVSTADRQFVFEKVEPLYKAMKELNSDYGFVLNEQKIAMKTLKEDYKDILECSFFRCGDDVAVAYISGSVAFLYVNTIENIESYLFSIGIERVFFGYRNTFFRDDSPTLIKHIPENAIVGHNYVLSKKRKRSLFDSQKENIESNLSNFDINLIVESENKLLRITTEAYDSLPIYSELLKTTGVRNLLKIYKHNDMVSVLNMPSRRVWLINGNSTSDYTQLEGIFLESGFKTHRHTTLSREECQDIINKAQEDSKKPAMLFEYGKDSINTEGKSGKNLRKIINGIEKKDNTRFEMHEFNSLSDTELDEVIKTLASIKKAWGDDKRIKNKCNKDFSYFNILRFLKRDKIKNFDILLSLLYYRDKPVAMSITARGARKFVSLLEGCSLNLVDDSIDLSGIQKYMHYKELTYWCNKLGDDTLFDMGYSISLGLTQWKLNLGPKFIYRSRLIKP